MENLKVKEIIKIEDNPSFYKCESVSAATFNNMVDKIYADIIKKIKY